MKTKTVFGTSVEILGICGDNLVLVDVLPRHYKSQLNAKDLILPDEPLPPELQDLEFYEEPTVTQDEAEPETDKTPKEEKA